MADRRSKPISGGIPHCFPQFGPGELQQHGFARNLNWSITSTSADLQPDERDPQEGGNLLLFKAYWSRLTAYPIRSVCRSA